MKTAIGSSLLMGIIITFVTIVLFIIISSMVYTKAFRIKNRIVDIIETREQYNDDVEDEITIMLRQIGYKANPYSNNSQCDKYGEDLENLYSPYHYCVFRMSSGKNDGYYYKVVAFAYLDLPLVSTIQLPVSGETKIFYPKK